MKDGLVGLEIEERGDVVVAHVTGELDIAGAPHAASGSAEAVPDVRARPRRGHERARLHRLERRGDAVRPGAAARRAGARSCAWWRPEGRPVARVLEIVEFERAAPVRVDLAAALAEI